ncbi:arginase, hepatic-like [Panulirus ornatus]|uniref:arginase, hepatic-like n=1 Tax=Panulirus ornatus TaxID=150431 RepID=UPI003A8677EB
MLRTLLRRSARLGAAAQYAASPLARHLHVGVVEAPFNRGQRRLGVEDGPRAIKDTGVLSELQNLGVGVLNYGSVEMTECADSQAGPSGERHHPTVLGYSRRLASSVAQVVRDGRICLTLGGDHSIAIGTVNGHAQANPDHQVVVLWVDAHSDINTGSSSGTGNMHGMPVSHHLREMATQVNRLPDNWPQPCISSQHIAYIGLRDIDKKESEFMKDLGILRFGMRELDQLGVSAVITRCMEHLQPSAMRPLHLSFDIDSLDPMEAPSTGTPVRGGINLREGLNITEAVWKSGLLRALDLVEVNPHLGTKEDAALTADAARLVLLSALSGYRGA